MWLLISFGGIVGAYIPTWVAHVGYFSVWGILGSGVGGIAGLYASRSLDNYLS